MRYLFSERNSSLLEKLNSCGGFTVIAKKNDGFPQYICKNCTKLLESAYEFKVLCEIADAKFRALAANFVSVKEEEEQLSDEVCQSDGEDSTGESGGNVELENAVMDEQHDETQTDFHDEDNSATSG